MTKKRSSQFWRDEIIKFFRESLGERNREGNLWVEMCSHEFFLKHALRIGKGLVGETLVIICCVSAFKRVPVIDIDYRAFYTIGVIHLLRPHGGGRGSGSGGRMRTGEWVSYLWTSTQKMSPLTSSCLLPMQSWWFLWTRISSYNGMKSGNLLPI